MSMIKSAVFLFAVSWASAGLAQSCKPMTTEQLTQLTAKGATIKLGGEGQGIDGTLKLKKDGTAKGSAKLGSGDKITIAGVWHIGDDKFCRTWEGGRNAGQEICETWCLTSGNSVDVYNGKDKIGSNSW